MDWEQYRNEDGTLDLLKMFDESSKNQTFNNYNAGYKYIRNVVALQPITNPEVAAVILINAIEKAQ